jgi:hypothetical protein
LSINERWDRVIPDVKDELIPLVFDLRDEIILSYVWMEG